MYVIYLHYIRSKLFFLETENFELNFLKLIKEEIIINSFM